jgi:hypothetical protein
MQREAFFTFLAEEAGETPKIIARPRSDAVFYRLYFRKRNETVFIAPDTDTIEATTNALAEATRRALQRAGAAFLQQIVIETIAEEGGVVISDETQAGARTVKLRMI